MSNKPTNPWDDLTEVVSLPYVAGDGSRQVRDFRLREMTRSECDRLTDLYYAGLEKLKREAGEFQAEERPTSELVKRTFALQWETQDEALQFILREPVDGGEPPSLEWIRQNLNERRFLLLTEAQDRLNGTDKAKKKAEQLAAAMALDAASRAGSSSTTESQPDTGASPTTSPDDTATARPNS